MNILRYKRQLQESSWLLGICENGFGHLKTGLIHWIDNGEYKAKKWFADPFILEYDEKQITLLVEEFDYKIHRGRLARLYIDRSTWTVTDCKIILDLETHLSFPMIWKENGHVYVCPENYASGAWNLYEYDKVNEKMVFVESVIKEKLTDAILYKDEKGYYVLSTYVPTPNGRKLTVYRSEKLKGSYKVAQEIMFAENIARNAGKIFVNNGQLIRPAQVCNDSYGQAISFQEVTRNDDGMISFKEIYRFFSPHSHYKMGAHTFNQHPDGMAVIDVKGLRYPIIGSLIKGIGNIFVNIGLKRAYRPQ